MAKGVVPALLSIFLKLVCDEVKQYNIRSQYCIRPQSVILPAVFGVGISVKFCVSCC